MSRMFPSLFFLLLMFFCTGVTYNGYGERWCVPTDETAMSKPAEYSSKGDDKVDWSDIAQGKWSGFIKQEMTKQAGKACKTMHPLCCLKCRDGNGRRVRGKEKASKQKSIKFHLEKKQKSFSPKNTEK